MTWTLSLVALGFLLMLAGFLLYTPDKPRDTLISAYARSPDDFLPLAGLQLHVRDDGPGDAPAVVMLHGLGGSLHSWEPWALALASEFRVIRFDFPGSGLSPPDPTGDYSTARDLEVLAALLDALNVRQVSLIGHSMGGRIAWNFAAKNPERIQRLVLVAPDGFASPGFEYDAPAVLPRSMAIMNFTLPRALYRSVLAPAYARPSFISEQLLTRYHDLMLAPGARQAFIGRMQQTVLVDPVPLLNTLHMPTLVLWGESDGMIPVSNASDYLAALPDATLITFPDVGHLPQEEAAAQSLPPVQQFLSALKYNESKP